MKRDTWKMVIQIAISIPTAIATSPALQATCSMRLPLHLFIYIGGAILFIPQGVIKGLCH